MSDQENHIVHKSNELIEAKFKLPLIEQRILAICISKINPTRKSLENPYRFNIKEYCTLTKSESKGLHQKIRDALISLDNRGLIKYDPDTGRTRKYSWTSHIDIWDSHSYDIYFHKEIEADLLAKTKYTKYLLKSVFNLNSKYSLRLYEVCKQRKGQAKAPKLSLENLRILLGVDDGFYKDYRDFKKRCFQKAVDEINKQTDLNIDYNEFRTNRQVDLIELIITESKPAAPELKELKKKETSKPSDDPDLFELMADKSEENILIENLQAIHVQPRATLKLIDEFGVNEVSRVYEDIKNKTFKEGTNLAGVLINKLKDDLEAKTVTAKKELTTKIQVASVEENRAWWNETHHELLSKPFWLQDKPLFLKNPPSRVETDAYCMFNSETVMFSRSDFQEYILEKVKSWNYKLEQRGF